MALKPGSAFGGSGTAVAGAAGLAAVAVAAAVGFSVWRGEAPEQEAALPADTVGETAPTVDPVVSPDATTATEANAPAEVSPEAERRPDILLPDEPRFDLVRVEADGSAVIAGQSSAEAMITLRLDGDPIEVTQADLGGNFVALLALAPSDSPRLLSLEAALDGGEPVPGAETVIIAPFGGLEAVALAENGDGAPSEDGALETVAPEEGAATAQDVLEAPEPPPSIRTDRPGIAALSEDPDLDAETAAPPGPEQIAALPHADTEQAPTPDTAPPPQDTAAPDADEAASATSEAPAVLIASEDGVRVLQSADGAPSAQTEVQLDAISYDLEGDVTLAGRGPASSGLRILLNNQPIQMGEVGPGGDWRLDLPEVDPGTYTLSVEQLSAAGEVTSRIDTPFLREDPDRIAASPMLVADGASVITVQPGFTLWGIAQANFGEGVLYVSIFQENRDQIRDPDLIFPGQIFSLPELPRVAPGE